MKSDIDMLDLDIIEINSEQIEEARALASKLTTSDLRKKGMMDMLGILCARRFLLGQRLKVDSTRSIYKIPILYEEFKITDLYHLGYRVDVITLYKEKSVKIPKIHVDMDILPDFYFIVQIGAKIKEAKSIGFIDYKTVLSSPHDSRFYYPIVENIFDIEKFRSLTKMPALKPAVPAKHKECMELFLKFIDNELPSVYKRQMIRHLLDCPSCLQRFSDAVEFEKLSNNIENYPELIKKYEIRSIQPIETNKNEQNDNLPLKLLNDEFEEVQGEEEMEIEYVTHSQSNDIPIKQEPLKQEQDLIKTNKKPMDYENSVKKYIKEVVNETVKDSLIGKSPNRELKEFTKKPIKKEPQNQAPKEIQPPIESTKKEEVIEEIFDESKEIELPSKTNTIKLGRKRLIITSSIMFLILLILSVVAYKTSQDYVYQPEDDQIAAEDQGYEDEYSYDNYDDTQANPLPPNANQEDFVLKRPESNKNTYNPSIAKISWEAPESLVKKDSYTKFLQATGKNIKLNLQNELLLVNDIPINKEVRADIKINSHGEVNSIKILKTSGSEAIDIAVKRVIEDTLKYIKSPNTGLSKPFIITLTVSLN